MRISMTSVLSRIAIAVIACAGLAPVRAQDSPGDPAGSALGASPGDTGAVGGGGAEAVIPVGPGPSYPRVPAGITQPPVSFGPQSSLGMEPISIVPRSELPETGVLAIARGDEFDDQGSGITIDQAIDRLTQFNLELRAQAFEIPKARADLLTAGLRGNPLFYADSAFIPYGNFEGSGGGPTEYAANITLPLDVNGKRKRRVEAATCALRVTEAQYQDAVRIQLDNLYTAWIDVLAARATIRFLTFGTEILETQKKLLEERVRKGTVSQSEVNNVEIQRDSTELSLLEAQETYDDAKRTLAAMICLPIAQAEAYQIQGSLQGIDRPAPPVDALIQQALAVRPDLASFRLGVGRAQSERRLAQANRLDDMFLLYQPFAMQEGLVPGDRAATSWAIGVTIPVPIFNRNQGNIARADHTIVQTQVQLASLERQVILEVQRAEAAYSVTLANIKRIRDEILPAARENLERSLAGTGPDAPDPISRIEAQRTFGEISRQYLDALVRHRSSMLHLNTAVGVRVFP